MKWAQLARLAVEGMHAQQDVDELAVVLSCLDLLVEPRTILEIGTAQGGMAWALGRLPSVQHLVTVDLVKPESRAWADRPHVQYDVVTGNSQLPDTYEQVVKALDGDEPQVVLIDGAHDYEAASRDFYLYAGLCSLGGVVLLHDSQGYPGHPEFGVGQLVAELREHRPVLELYSRPGGPAGTAIVWADTETHGLQYNDLHN